MLKGRLSPRNIRGWIAKAKTRHATGGALRKRINRNDSGFEPALERLVAKIEDRAERLRVEREVQRQVLN